MQGFFSYLIEKTNTPNSTYSHLVFHIKFCLFFLPRILVPYVVSNNAITAGKLKQVLLIVVINVGLAALCPERIQRCTVKSISQMPVKGRSYSEELSL